MITKVIKVKEDVKLRLDQLRIYPKEPYSSIIERLININERHRAIMENRRSNNDRPLIKRIIDEAQKRNI